MTERMIPDGNFERPYVEGTWMVAVRDHHQDNVYLVGPDERVRLVVNIDGRGITIVERIKLAKQIEAALNAHK